jgi:hypothetical protein
MAQSPHGTICRRLRSLFRPSAIHSERRNRSTTALCLALIERSVSVWGWGGDGCGRDKFRGFEWKTSGKSMDFRNHGGVLIGNPWDFAVCFFFFAMQFWRSDFPLSVFGIMGILHFCGRHGVISILFKGSFSMIADSADSKMMILYADAEAVKSRFY